MTEIATHRATPAGAVQQRDIARRLEHARAVSDDLAGDVVIKCIQLTKLFRDFWMRNKVRAVDGIDLEVRRGEVFGLLGPNGSGKSTTIKLILGLLHATSGRIAVFGKLPENVANKRHIGYLPEETYLYPFLNARETLDYYGRLFHLNRPARQRRIDMLLSMVGLEHAQYRPIAQYSKGMQRKIGLAQALINDPDLLILDEPTSGMDPVATADVKRLITTLVDRGKTILLSSHLLADVEDVCDRAAIMFGGKVRAYGGIDELLVQQSRTTITTPALDEQTIEQIEQVLEQHGKHIEKVQQPRQTLESKFLEIVERAQAEGLATSGARSGGKIADFLSQGAAPRASEGAQVIEELINPQAPPSARPPQRDDARHDASPASASGAPLPEDDEQIAQAARSEAAAEAAAAEAAVIADLVQPQDSPAPMAAQPEPAPAPPAGKRREAPGVKPDARRDAAPVAERSKPKPSTTTPRPAPAPRPTAPTGDVDLSLIQGLIAGDPPPAPPRHPPVTPKAVDYESPDPKFKDAMTNAEPTDAVPQEYRKQASKSKASAAGKSGKGDAANPSNDPKREDD